MNRREFLAMSITAPAYAALRSSVLSPLLAGPQDPKARFDRGFASVYEIADGVFATIADTSKGPQCLSNGGVIVGKKAVLIIEGHFQPAGAALEIEVARTVTKSPICGAVDTHYHLDHSFGNSAYADEKIPIIAHERTATMMKERYAAHQSDDRVAQLAPFEKKLAAAANEREKQHRQSDLGAETWMADSIRSARLVYPTESVSTTKPMRIDLGGVTAVLEAHPAHSPTDLVILVPERNVVFTGDLLFNHIYPVCIDADVRACAKVLDFFASLPSGTKFVPGHGPYGGREIVLEQKALLEDIHAHTKSMRNSGIDAEEAARRYVVPKRFEGFEIFSWDWCIGDALRSFYRST
jgi:cyclase